MRFRCLRKGLCCKRYWIPVTHLDLARILEFVNMSLEELIDLKSVEVYGNYPQIPQVLVNGRLYYLSLRDREDGSCIFLDEEKGVCLIHPAKPIVCRFYPFTYKIAGDEIVVTVSEGAVGACPGLVDDDGPIDAKIVEEVRKLARIHMFEVGLWKAACIEWNRYGGGDEKSFLQYLRKLIERDRALATQLSSHESVYEVHR